MAKIKRTKEHVNNEQQNITQKPTDRATPTPQKTQVLRKGKQFLLHLQHLSLQTQW